MDEWLRIEGGGTGNNDYDEYQEVYDLTETGDSRPLAHYDDINVADVSAKAKLAATNIIKLTTGFIKKFKDVEMTAEVTAYIDALGDEATASFANMIQSVEINKLMINNMIHRVNSNMGDNTYDVQAYIQLMTLQTKLVKECDNFYKNIPSDLKRMRTEIICSVELEENGRGDESVGNEISSNRDRIMELAERRKKMQQDNNN